MIEVLLRNGVWKNTNLANYLISQGWFSCTVTHMVYHVVLTYSNWEWINVCFSESFESLSEGIQGALWA